MIIKEKDKITMLCAEEGLKITDKNKSFFSDFIYVPKNYNPDNYEELPRSVWKNYVEDESTDFDILQEKISDNNLMIVNLEELLLDTDFRLMCLEMGITP